MGPPDNYKIMDVTKEVWDKTYDCIIKGAFLPRKARHPPHAEAGRRIHLVHLHTELPEWLGRSVNASAELFHLPKIFQERHLTLYSFVLH
jgi:hypothetical protein